MARVPGPVAVETGHPLGRPGTDPFALLHREVTRLFDDALRGGALAGTSGAAVSAPRMNVSETNHELRVEIELPGVAEQDIQVELADDLLTVRGEKRAEHGDAHHHVVERSFGTFARTVRLPFAPEPDKVRATFERGVLRIALPTSAPEARSRRIPVQSAAAHQGQDPHGTSAAVAGHPTPNTTQAAIEPDESVGHPT